MKTCLTLLGVIASSFLACGSSDRPTSKTTAANGAFATLCATTCPDKAPAPTAPAQPAPKSDPKKSKREPRPARPEFLFL